MWKHDVCLGQVGEAVRRGWTGDLTYFDSMLRKPQIADMVSLGSWKSQKQFP